MKPTSIFLRNISWSGATDLLSQIIDAFVELLSFKKCTFYILATIVVSMIFFSSFTTHQQSSKTMSFYTYVGITFFWAFGTNGEYSLKLTGRTKQSFYL